MLLPSVVVAAVLAAQLQGRGLVIVRGAWAAIPAAEPAAGLPALGESAAVPPPAPERHSPTAAYVVMGLSGLAVATGIVIGVQALNQKRDFDNGDRTTQRVEAIERKAILADMAFGAALTFAITGAVLWWTDHDGGTGLTAQVPPDTHRRASQGRLSVHLVPLVSPHGNGAVALFRF